MSRTLLYAGAAALSLLAALPAQAQTQAADTILFNGKVVTLAAQGPAEAVAIADGKIIAVGPSATVRALQGPNTRAIAQDDHRRPEAWVQVRPRRRRGQERPLRLSQRQGRALAMLAIVSTSLGCDQGTKRLADLALKDHSPLNFFGRSVRLLYAQNTGAWGSLGANWAPPVKTTVFVVLPGLFLLGMLLHALFSNGLTRWHVLGWGLVVGGGIGNLIDRVRDGYVIDFMFMGVGPLHTNIFNVADVVLLVGIALMFTRRRRVRWL